MSITIIKFYSASVALKFRSFPWSVHVSSPVNDHLHPFCDFLITSGSVFEEANYLAILRDIDYVETALLFF